MKNCVIVRNAFSVKDSSEFHINRYKEEFARAGVSCRVEKNLAPAIIEGVEARIASKFRADFWLYLDKDVHTAEAAEAAGMRVFNCASALRQADDKAATFCALAKSGAVMPKTIFAPLMYNLQDGGATAVQFLQRVADEIGFPAVVKECHGSFGRQVYLARNAAELAALYSNLCLRPHLYQRFIKSSEGRDMRIIVIGGRHFSAMTRTAAEGFKANIELGGRAEFIAAPPKEFVFAAETAAGVLNLDYCGVDLLFGQGGEPLLCEVNPNAYFCAMERVSGKNVAEAHVKHIINKVY